MELPPGLGGLLQVVTPTHVIALTGLGLITGRNSASAGIASIAAFALGLAIGLGAIASGAGETPANEVLLAGAALCGLTAASGVAVPAALAAAVALVSGAALGLDSPPDAIRLGEAVAALLATAGGSIAALALIAFSAVALAHRWQGGIVVRVAGSWIAAIAILALALRWAA
jgi:hypothetical protein